VLKTEQIDSPKNPAFPDFPGENAARTEMNYRMPMVKKVSAGRNYYFGGLDDKSQSCVPC